MKIIAIETSCDETGISLVDARGRLSKPRFKVIENLVSSQIKIHAPFGGVVPNLAKREHLKNLPILWKKLKKKNPGAVKKVDLIAVTVGPGLEPALWTGINFAKTLSLKLKKPVVGANHLEGHLYSFLLPRLKKTVMSNFQFPISKIFPAIALIVSGGHTILLFLESFSMWRKLGETRDDAAGEAFDKVARILGLPYPGGPEIEKLARRGNQNAIAFPRPMMKNNSDDRRGRSPGQKRRGNYDFSFSGLKTSVLYYLRDHPRDKKSDIAASFQKAALDVLAWKTMRAAKEYGARSVLLSGGVAANKLLRRLMKNDSKKLGINFLVPDMAYNLDNAAMIGAAGYLAFLRKKKYPLAANGNLGI